MGRKFYEIVFVAAFLSGLFTGISIAFRVDINPINIALDAGDKIINATSSATQTIQLAQPSSVGQFDVQKMWGDAKILILIADAASLIIAGVMALIYGVLGILCFLCSLAGGLLLPLGVSDGNFGIMLIATGLIVVGGSIAFKINDNT
jgi:hypothetical protein